MKYQVQVHDHNSRYEDGRPVILRDCGHRHRKLSAALACKHRLCRRYPDGAYPAAWFNSSVYHEDGSKLDNEELSAMVEGDATMEGIRW